MSGSGIERHAAIGVFLDDVCDQVKAREKHDEIRLELRSHLEELAHENLDRRGVDTGEQVTDAKAVDEAVRDAIRQMGDARTIGKRLHRTHKPKTEWSLVGIAALLVGLGLFAMAAVETAYHSHSHLGSVHFLASKAGFDLAGAAALVALYFFDYRKLQPRSWPVYAAAVGLMLYALHAPLGTIENGVQKWIQIAGVAIDAASIAPYLFLIAYAGYLTAAEKRPPRNPRERRLIYARELGLFYALPVCLYVQVPSLLAAAIHLVGASCLLLISKGGRRRFALYLAAGAALSVALFPYLTATRAGASYNNRLFGSSPYPGPSSYPLAYIRSAGFKGQGFEAAFHQLPALYGENVVAFLVGSLGWAFGIGLALLVAVFIYRIVRIAALMRDRYARLLVVGLSSVLAVKLAWSLLMAVGLLPFAGIPMPLVGSNGFGTVVELAAIGFVLGVFRRKDCIRLPGAAVPSTV